MKDYKIIVNKLNQALYLVEPILSDTQINFIRSYIYCGEWSLALETLCDILSEDDLPIQSKAYELFQEIGLELNVDPTIFEVLKPQVLR